MESTPRPFLLFLRKLVSFFRKRWDQSIRGLWLIFALLRSRFSPRRPKKRDEIRRNIESRPAKPSAAVICASRLPPPLTPIAGGDTPIASPTPISIQVRHPTILNTEDTLYETRENQSTEHLGVNSYFLEESGSISRSPDSAGQHHEPEPIHAVMSPHREVHTSYHPYPPVIPSRPHSQYSHRPPSQYSVHRPPSQYSHRPASQYSYRSPPNVSGAEAAARGYLHAPPSTRPSSPALSIHPPSVAGSDASHVYRASRPTTRVRRPSPMRNTSQRRARSSTPASTRQSVHDPPPPVPPEHPQPESRTSISIPDRHSAAANSEQALPLKDTLRPMIGIDRYENHKAVTIEDVLRTHICPPATTQFVPDSTPENWTPLMHPEGALYWVHKTKPIYTDTDMYNSVLLEEIEQAVEEINKLRETLRETSPPLPEDWELVLELAKDDETSEPICRYYFACLSTRCLFWLHEFDLESVLEDVCGVTENTHIHLALQAQYWSHWEMFPHDREVPEGIIQELTGILLHAGIDCMTSTNSTAAYSEPDINKLLAYVRHLKSVGGNYGFSACVVGRLMNFLTFSRYINFYGQKGARLTNDQTIYGVQPKRTYLIKILSIFFFYAPELHLRGLETVYTDFILCQHRWAHFITRLQNDWAEFILYGTVLLNANVAFLAIPSVDPGSGPGNHTRSPVQVASYISIVTSVGSVVIGLLLLRQHRTKPQDSADEVNKYLRSRHDNALGFETLAILFSLPYSLLLWSMIAFTTAFSLEALMFSSELWARLPVGIVLAMMILLTSWCVWTSLEARKKFSILDGVHVLRDRLVNFTRSLRGKPDASDCGSDDGRDGMLKEAFTRLRQLRRPRVSVSSTLVNAAGNNEPYGPPNGAGVEMSEINKKEPGDAV